MNRLRHVIGIGALSTLGLVWQAGCKQAAHNLPPAPTGAGPTLQFEPHPQSLSLLANISATRHPRIGADAVASGVVHFLVVIGDGEDSRLAMLNSNDSGDTYEKPVWISEEGVAVSSHGENSPTLIVRPDITYAAWNQQGDIRLARSLSWGQSFERPVRISEKPARFQSAWRRTAMFTRFGSIHATASTAKRSTRSTRRAPPIAEGRLGRMSAWQHTSANVVVRTLRLDPIMRC